MTFEFNESENDKKRIEFRHQLLSDYLVANHLSFLKEEKWRANIFDTATFRAASFDSLEFATELLRIKSDTFLNEVYDWNWKAVLETLSNLNLNKNIADFTLSNHFIASITPSVASFALSLALSSSIPKSSTKL